MTNSDKKSKTVPQHDWRLLSVDPSLRASGFALFSQKGLETVYLLKPKTKDDDRFWEIAQKAKAVMDKLKPTALAIEEQYIAIRSSSVIKVIEVKGIIEGVYFAYCLENNLPPIIFQVHPMEAKKKVGLLKRLPRKESKEAVKALVTKMYPMLETESQDIIDSVAIGVAGCYRYDLKRIIN